MTTPVNETHLQYSSLLVEMQVSHAVYDLHPDFFPLILVDRNTDQLLEHRSAVVLYVQKSCRPYQQKPHSSPEALMDPSHHVLFLIGLRHP